MDIRQFILPGGVGLSHVRVYTEAPANGGIPGGGGHVHLVCAEMYYVLKGTGAIELLSMKGLETVELAPNKVVFFRPGIFHRVLNPNRDLELLAIMQNGGLPERGDFVMSFPSEILASASSYAQSVRVQNLADALRRRDLSLRGYESLKEAFSRSIDDGQAALRAFYRQARNLIAPKVDGFEWVLKLGAQTEAKDSLDACDFIRAGRTAYLERSRYAAISATADPGVAGIGGDVHSFALDETFLTDGRKVA